MIDRLPKSVLCVISLAVFAFALVGCGSIATPVWEKPEATPTTAESGQVVVQPTTTPIPPTDTPIPPTATTVPPTATTVPPTATPQPQANDPISVLVSISNPAHGKQLFETFNDQAGYACATCHNVASEDRLIGPGLLNVGTRAATRVAGEVAERYIYNSITTPDAYVVEGFVDTLMPEVYSQIFTEQDIYDIIAYLMTLK